MKAARPSRKARGKPHRVRLLTPAEVAQFFAALAEKIDPKPELVYESALDLVVAVVLSAQCTDKTVNRVTKDLFARCRAPRDYLDLGEDRLQETIRSIGLYRNKSKAIIGICRALEERFGGQVPGTRAALESLPGVGPKSASIVLNVIFRQPTIAVDTHVFRVANRTGLVREKTPDKTAAALERIVPAAYRLDAHHYLILHGRYTCVARRPKCPTCPVAAFCHWPEKTPPGSPQP